MAEPILAKIPKAAHKSGSQVMLRTGEHDDAIFYYAEFVENAGVLSVRLHAGSLLLERLKLFGAMTLVVQFDDGLAFHATLKLAKPSHDDRAIISLGDAFYCDAPSEQALRLHT